ncbi:hypothetical protein CXF68_16285 [Tenacibaculum sp. Bg11-29]|uniref:M48 family metallopeptidase n=1 Tax=Tenacibaculum sp. Bg11-29 TaxID=2058306 RepID=UPI000C339634|nr:M48 family metallopeptidase [Tenacibaculum sp. Bg11-29]PKH52153.1 hypothetical protein CXF68_16285 [Tenacibaculum sp. Bg11-29]
MNTNYYPKSPKSLPKNLTNLPATYLFRATLAVLAIVLFFALYIGLVIGLGYLVYYAFIYDMGHVNKITILLKVGAIAGAAMLFVFTLKFILKLKNDKQVNRIKLKKEEHAELWGFIHTICKETGAPKPKNIYVDPDVNAYVSYTNMWLSLFLPVKKELTIGMGLVSCLNLSEFKAVMSHEFGHFSQRSMKIGSYIISANTIIHGMIYDRDKWDDLLDQWRASDIRLSAAAWVITPVIWVIRQVLGLFYMFLNLMYSSLSREMEFNADKVAISTSGSDAILSGLWRLDSGFEKWNATINNAYLASKKKLFVKNLYTHNTQSLAEIAEEQHRLLSNLSKDSRGGQTYFTSSLVSKADMYASHPTNDKRQDNAKVPYIVCEQDNRSPWLLFSNPTILQEEMTSLIYKQYINSEPKEFARDVAFREFMVQESQGKELLAEYYNTFENRFLHIDTPENLRYEAIKNKNILATVAKSHKKELLELMKPIQELEALMLKASQIAEGSVLENSFTFKNKEYKKKDLNEGYQLIITEREELFNNSFKDWDTSFCGFHLALAKQKAKAEALLQVYAQHNTIIKVYKDFVTCKNIIFNEVNELQTKEDVTDGQVTILKSTINRKVEELNDSLSLFDSMVFIPMPNIETIEELKEAIVTEGKFKGEAGDIFNNGGFDKIIENIDNAIVHCQRIDQKSIGVILAFHKELQNGLLN